MFLWNVAMRSFAGVTFFHLLFLNFLFKKKKVKLLFS